MEVHSFSCLDFLPSLRIHEIKPKQNNDEMRQSDVPSQRFASSVA
jgi:hypothetical protein